MPVRVLLVAPFLVKTLTFYIFVMIVFDVDRPTSSRRPASYHRSDDLQGTKDLAKRIAPFVSRDRIDEHWDYNYHLNQILWMQDME